MIQRIRQMWTGTEFVCEIPEGWNAAMYTDGKKPAIIMVHPASAPVILQQDADGLWRQREVQVASDGSPA